jgi:hypothetical protein
LISGLGRFILGIVPDLGRDVDHQAIDSTHVFEIIRLDLSRRLQMNEARMSRFVLILFLLPQLSELSFAARRVNVEQLNQVVTSSRGKHDDKIADRILDLVLAERLSPEKLVEMQAALPGPLSRQSLTVIADVAEFQDPPAAELPNQAAPTLEAQRDIAAKAIDYLHTKILRQPNRVVSRETTHFEDTPAIQQPPKPDSPSGTFIAPQPLHVTNRLSATVVYRNGEEFIQTATGEEAVTSSDSVGLSTFGEYGPIVSTIFRDLAAGRLMWKRWGQSSGKPEAVFGYVVPKDASHYQIQFCCVDGKLVKQFSAYHGELVVDPADGTVLRLTVVTDLAKRDPVTRADLMVEWGPVELGGQTCFCPKKSVAVSVAPMQPTGQKYLPGFATGMMDPNFVELDHNRGVGGPPQTMLDEVVFDHYRAN